MNMQLLIVYAKSTSEITNRKSALGSYIYCLAEILESQGISVQINGSRFKELKSSQPRDNYSANASRNRFWFIPKPLKNSLKIRLVKKRVTELCEDIVAKGPYTIVIEFFTLGSNIGKTVCDKFNIPRILIYDGPSLEEFLYFNGKLPIYKKYLEKQEIMALNDATYIVAYSRAVKEYLEKKCKKTLPVRIHQNVDFSRFDVIKPRLIEQTINIGFIGSFLKWHKVDLLLRVFEELKQKGCNVRLWLIGAGEQWADIKALVEKSEFKEFIEISGFCDGAQLKNLKAQLHIGVMPGSNWYGAPNKIFEYGAAGLAVVAPGTPTILDLFENKKQLLAFEWDNESDAFDQIFKLVNDPELISNLQENLQNVVLKKYSTVNTSNFYMDLIKQSLTI